MKTPAGGETVQGRPPRPGDPAPEARAGAPGIAAPSLAIVCIGNTLMCDDGVGAAVARELERIGVPEGTALHVRQNADMGLVGLLRESAAAIAVDAVDLGAEPGTVFRFTPDEAGLTRMRSHNIHGMGLGYALTHARLLGADPEVVVFGVQPGDIRPLPDTLSTEVAASVERVAALVAEEARSLIRSRSRRADAEAG